MTDLYDRAFGLDCVKLTYLCPFPVLIIAYNYPFVARRAVPLQLQSFLYDMNNPNAAYGSDIQVHCPRCHWIRIQDLSFTHYTVLRKKVVYLIFGRNFCKYRPILKILSQSDSQTTSPYSSIIKISTSTELLWYTTLLNLKIQNNR